jgi:energy-coupling factor transporter ATP-binding protein EcfA2
MTRIRRHEETLAEQNCTPDSLTTSQKQIAAFACVIACPPILL